MCRQDGTATWQLRCRHAAQPSPAGGGHRQQLGAGGPGLWRGGGVAEQLAHGVAAACGDGAPGRQRLLPALIGGVGPAQQMGDGGQGSGTGVATDQLLVGGVGCARGPEKGSSIGDAERAARTESSKQQIRISKLTGAQAARLYSSQGSAHENMSSGGTTQPVNCSREHVMLIEQQGYNSTSQLLTGTQAAGTEQMR